MRAFLRCVAEAVLENGVKGLVGMVPGGAFAYAVAEGVQKKLRERRELAALREQMGEMVAAGFDEVKAEVQVVVAEAVAATAVPDAPPPAPEDVAGLELFLAAIPEAARASLKRPEDPTGRTVPPGFRVETPDDVIKLLPPRSPRFRPGDALPGKGGWVLDRMLGVGGFGEVWYTRHTRMTSLTGAVKFCLGQSGRDLIHEADLIDRVMAGGRHPNIVPLLDAHLDGDAPWLLFEYVGGGCLTDWVHQLAGMPADRRLKQVLAALGQLADAVATFHALAVPIVHRDLKPANVLLDKASKKLRITDFGIGSVTAQVTLRDEARGTSTRGGRLLTYLRGSHTPLYASPQQRAGAEPDPRDDVHALGVIAYQMLTGHLAQGAGPDFADDLRDTGATEDLIALLGRCVAQKPDRRPKDARELRDLLTRTAAPASPPPAPPPPAADWSDVERDAAERVRDRARGGLANTWIAPRVARVPRWKDAAAAGNPSGQYLFGLCLDCGVGAPEDDATAFVWLFKAAQAGFPPAMASLGVMYDGGQGIPLSHEEACRWYRKAADAGDAAGARNLGFQYENGTGVPQSFDEASKWYRRSADLGDSPAMLRLGWLCQSGAGGKTADPARALAWYRKAADAGNAAAMCQVGVMYETGVGVAADAAEAARWYHKASDLGNGTAMSNLGWLNESGSGVPADPGAAFLWYRKAEQAGDVQGTLRLGLAYFNGIGTAADPAAAARSFRTAADAGEPTAMNNLGWVLANGHGVSANPAEAARWYAKAADAGSADAMRNLGAMHENGTGVPANPGEAVKWYRKAADAGDAAAMRQLGWMAQQGAAGKANPAEAVQWYFKAAAAGDVSAHNDLGFVHQNGVGMKQNLQGAAEWYLKAAQLGDPFGMANYGDCCANGTGVRRDDTSARAWYQKAAEAGNAVAMRNLGIFLNTGRGGPMNLGEAQEWFRRAAELGDEEAKKRYVPFTPPPAAEEESWDIALADDDELPPVPPPTGRRSGGGTLPPVPAPGWESVTIGEEPAGPKDGIEFRCPSCRTWITTPKTLAGRSVRCGACNNTATVPHRK